MASISIDNLVKKYDDGFPAVNDVSLDVADGEFLILVGPSGCGKSTLLRMVVGLEDITSGELRIGGQRMNEKPPKDRNLSMVFQNYALYPFLSVYENIAFPLKLAKGRHSKEEIDRKVREAARVLDLQDHLDRKPANLSGGQRQRVAMGRAIVRDADAFLFDEPLSNLDAKLRGQMRTEIAQLQRRLGVTSIYVTHDQTEAMTLGDRVAVLKKGRLQQVASPRELYEQPANLFVAGFIGAPSMNFLPARRRGWTLVTPLGEIPVPQAARDKVEQAGELLLLGVRPEHFEVLGIDDAASHGTADGRDSAADGAHRGGAHRAVGPEQEQSGLRAAGARVAEAVAEALPWSHSSEHDAQQPAGAAGHDAPEQAAAHRAGRRERGAEGAFETSFTHTEWLGNQQYGYVRYEQDPEIRRHLDQLAQELDADELPAQLVVELDAASRVRGGSATRLRIREDRMHLFDPESGENLTRDAEAGAALSREAEEERRAEIARHQAMERQERGERTR